VETAQGVGDDRDAVLVRAQGHHGTLGIDHFLQDHHLVLGLVAGPFNDVESYVQDDLLAGPQSLHREARARIDLHLAADGEPESIPDLAMRQSLDVAEHHHRAVVRRQFLDRRAQRRPQLGLTCGVVDTGRPVGHGLDVLAAVIEGREHLIQ
jgi:hypothetical protein